MPAGKPGAMADPETSYYGIKLAHVAAGAVGGFVSALLQPEAPILRRVTSALCGTVVAVYGTPVAAPIAARWLAGDFQPASLEGATGFLLGLTGMSLCDAAIKWVRLWKGPFK